MNVMNSNNIDNRLQLKRENSTKTIKMGEEKKLVMKYKTSLTGVKREETGETNFNEHVDVVKSTKVSLKGIKGKKIKRKRKSPLVPWKKPEGMPKRPLSAYNLFFQDRRKSIMLAASESNDDLLKESKLSHRKSSKKKSGVGFANLARTIGTEWRALDLEKKDPYNSLAAGDKDRYDKEMKVWRAKEKEEKSIRDSDLSAKNFTVVPTLSSILAATKGFEEDSRSIRNKTTDASLPLSEMIGRIGTVDQSVDILQPLQDHESRGVFHSSIYSNYNNNSYSMDTLSDQPSNVTAQQQQQDSNSYSSTSLHIADKRQVAQFNNSVIKDHFEQSSIVRENCPYNIAAMSAASCAQATQSCQYQNQAFIPSGNFSNSSLNTMPWINPRNILTMDNMITGSVDLEPLPLPDNYQQHQQQLKLCQKTARDSQIGWSGQHHGLLQMRGKEQQQQRITIASNGQYLQRLPTGGASLFAAGWGQNSNSWFDKNMNIADVNQSILIPLGDRNVSQNSGKNIATSTAINTVSQEIVNNPMENAKSRINDTLSLPSSSNASTQDPWNSIGMFNEGSN